MEKIDIQLLKTRLTELTPIEEYNGVFLKRDDKFVLGNANGGKLRQCIYLLLKNYDKIVNNNKGSVVCSCSIKSPQSGITATVCSALGLFCNIVTFKTKEPNVNLTIAQEEGASIYGSPSGYNSVIEAYAKKWFPSNFFTNMGFASNDILMANEDQVQNIPDNLDYLVVAVGSAMNFISVLRGLKKHNKKVGKVIGVYVGKEPFDAIHKYYPNAEIDFELVKYDKPYGTYVNIDNFFFDPIYEAKAYDWILRNLDYKNKKVMFWVVGRRNLEKPSQTIQYKEIDVRRLN